MFGKKKEAYNYFDSFVEAATYGNRAAVFLRDTLTDFDPAQLTKKMDQLHEIEHAADSISHRTMDALVKEFLPPIEREDIMSIAKALDDVVDSLDDIMRRMGMYALQKVRPEAIQFSDLLVRATGELVSLMREFSQFKKSRNIRKSIIEINDIETEGDTLHYAAMSSLYGSQADAREVAVWTTLFDAFEDCCDHCEDVSDLAGSVILKNS